MARTRIYFRFYFFFLCVIGIHRGKKSRMKDTMKEGREKERSLSLPEAQGRDGMSDDGRMRREDGRGKTGDAGLEAHT